MSRMRRVRCSACVVWSCVPAYTANSLRLNKHHHSQVDTSKRIWFAVVRMWMSYCLYLQFSSIILAKYFLFWIFKSKFLILHSLCAIYQTIRIHILFSQNRDWEHCKLIQKTDKYRRKFAHCFILYTRKRKTNKNSPCKVGYTFCVNYHKKGAKTQKRTGNVNSV